MSVCYETWASGIATDTQTLGLIDRLPSARRQPNLVFGAARLLGAEVSDYEQFAGWLTEHWGEVEAVCLSRATQTNEPGRCAALVPATVSAVWSFGVKQRVPSLFPMNSPLWCGEPEST